MQTISGAEPHIMVIGMPQAIMRVIMSLHSDIISIGIMSPPIMVQRMPSAVISQFILGIIGMPQTIIIGMPLQVIMQGMPLAIMLFSMSQQSRIMPIDMPSVGVMVQLRPSSVISVLMWHIIGLIIMPIAGVSVIGIVIIAFMAAPGVNVEISRTRDIHRASPDAFLKFDHVLMHASSKRVRRPGRCLLQRRARP
ncbi:hypothetical protein [Eleftheria terrae]|uniref:hypothetical protein n=1 Tax=Eleftheria terrae TaxID=1597781 RepID=UPI00263B15DA|nr:hypothetical protein [Eleftheria terrae]WKB55859.1 hypothetical protein N7L95_27670 [Eleftheria terrae]